MSSGFVRLYLSALFLLLFPQGVAASRAAAPSADRLVDRPASAATREPDTREARAASGTAVDFSHYPTYAQIVEYLQDLNASYPALTELYTLGTTWQGKPIMGIRLGNEATGDPESRPAFYVDGQHHAREPISQQVALYFVDRLLASYGSDPLSTFLLDHRALYVVPCVNPDGNDIFLSTDVSQRRNANPYSSDDDFDGHVPFDEDPANGAGWGSYKLDRYDFDNHWVQLYPDDPFSTGWELWVLGIQDRGLVDEAGQPAPQLDDDGDGWVNEDGIGGVDLNRNYDLHWELGDSYPASEVYRGDSPWSEPESRAVRDLLSSHPNIQVAATLHSGANVILYPWGWSETARLGDAVTLERLARKGSQLTEGDGVLGAPHTWTARGLYTLAGSSLDWMYSQGVYAFSPEVYVGEERGRVERVPGEAAYLVYSSQGLAYNPPAEQMMPVLQRWEAYLRYLFAATPGVALTRVDAVDGGLGIGAANEGGVPAMVDVRAAVDGQPEGSLGAQVLLGREGGWGLALTPGVPHEVTLTATLADLISTGPRGAFSQTVTIQVDADGTPHITGGALSGWANLAQYFGPGGWSADESRWDVPYVYHLGQAVGFRVRLPVAIRP